MKLKLPGFIISSVDLEDVRLGDVDDLEVELSNPGVLVELKLGRKGEGFVKIVVHARGALRFEKWVKGRAYHLVKTKWTAGHSDTLAPPPPYWSESRPYANTDFEYHTVNLGLDVLLGGPGEKIKQR